MSNPILTKIPPKVDLIQSTAEVYAEIYAAYKQNLERAKSSVLEDIKNKSYSVSMKRKYYIGPKYITFKIHVSDVYCSISEYDKGRLYRQLVREYKDTHTKALIEDMSEYAKEIMHMCNGGGILVGYSIDSYYNDPQYYGLDILLHTNLTKDQLDKAILNV